MSAQKKRVSFPSTILALLAIGILIHLESASAQVQEEWMTLYSRPDPRRANSANALKVDTSGNVYVAGSVLSSASTTKFWSYFTTIKYDANGKELWVQELCGGQATGYANALAVDEKGNAYVTGKCGEVFEGATTVKYDTNGNVQWVAQIGWPGLSHAEALAVDAEGSVYVTGYGYTTVKHDANGKKLWEADYTGPSDFGDHASAIALDSSGSVYVTGYSHGPENDQDCATIRYDANGKELWVARYDGPGNLDDTASALALDSDGSVYITGYSHGSDTGQDYATIKYDANGKELWVQRYNGPGNLDDAASALTLDSSGGVYLTGYSHGSGTGQDYATIKYDANGEEQWVGRYNGSDNLDDAASALAVDANGSVCVTGSSENGFATIKLQQNKDGSDQASGGENSGVCFISATLRASKHDYYSHLFCFNEGYPLD